MGTKETQKGCGYCSFELICESRGNHPRCNETHQFQHYSDRPENETKLLKLLGIAYENDFDIKIQNVLPKISDNDINKGFIVVNTDDKSNYVSYSLSNKKFKHFISLNDLITDFEDGKTSFIGALYDKMFEKYYNEDDGVWINFYNNHKIEYFTIKKSLVFYWTLQPTSKRLEWLFKTFEHLLKD